MKRIYTVHNENESRPTLAIMEYPAASFYKDVEEYFKHWGAFLTLIDHQNQCVNICTVYDSGKKECVIVPKAKKIASARKEIEAFVYSNAPSIAIEYNDSNLLIQRASDGSFWLKTNFTVSCRNNSYVFSGYQAGCYNGKELVKLIGRKYRFGSTYYPIVRFENEKRLKEITEQRELKHAELDKESDWDKISIADELYAIKRYKDENNCSLKDAVNFVRGVLNKNETNDTR